MNFHWQKFHNLIARSSISLLLTLPLTSFAVDEDNAKRPYWNDIAVIRENTEAPRAWYLAYPTRQEALEGNAGENQFYRTLNGAWKFHYSRFSCEPASRILSARIRCQ